MSDFRETRIERDAEGRIIGSTERIVEHPEKGGDARRPTNLNERHPVDRTERRRSGFGLGALVGLIIAGIALIVFALSQGSFIEAGREADQAASEAEQTLDRAAEETGDAAEQAGDNVERATN